jgi:hypothetical protein
MKSKALLFIGIILLVIGILIKKLTPFDSLGLASIIIGVTFKSIYIFSKAKSGEYKPGKELVFLILGLMLFFTGLYFRNVNQTLVEPVYLIVCGITFKLIFIIRFIQIVKSAKKLNP